MKYTLVTYRNSYDQQWYRERAAWMLIIKSSGVVCFYNMLAFKMANASFSQLILCSNLKNFVT